MTALKEKLALYSALADAIHNGYKQSETENDILFLLAQDADVQAHLQRCIDADKA